MKKAEERIETFLTRTNTLSKAAHNNASQCGHPCERFLVYRRHPDHWEKASRFSLRTLYAFWQGREMETVILNLIRDAGSKVTDEQRYIYDRGIDLSGMIDAEVDGLLTEVKLLQGYAWDRILNGTDFLNFGDSQFYYRNYYHQLNMYQYLLNREEAQYILFNKQNARI